MTVLLTGQWLRLDGTPAAGVVTVASWRTLASGATDTMLSTQPVEQRLDDEGRLAVDVPVAYDVPNVYVEVHVHLDFVRPESMVLVVPTTVATLDVADAERLQVDVAGPPGESAWVPLSDVGAANGVAPLDASGLVPAWHLPAGGGTGGSGVYPPTVFGYGPPPEHMTLLPGQIYLDQTNFLVYR